MLESHVKEMYFLYHSEIVKEAFNTHKLYCFLKKDLLYPVQSKVKKLNKHDLLIQEQNISSEVYFIQSGCVMEKKGQFLVNGFYTKGDIIGFDSLLLTDKSEYSLEVMSDEATIVKYKKAEIIEKILSTQEGYFYYYVHIQNQVKRLLEKEALLRLYSAEQRIESALLQLVSVYWDRDNEVALLPKYINKSILAKYTNLNSNTVTTVLQKLQKESIIQMDKRKIEINLIKLHAKLA
ncbi:Crp/Fnr family transcriptional regulator [Listeria rocourtiae]|uniref:Crp/Fnr family transcriptional regulator n=1 Tax=Listeria rocourtiae TaxID=647910 RepID=UPI001629B889|nr:Crp/Fnr family transcriptional regulator [Listeria rocourtiae]MBC1436008.1 Crp/Fnr family transcriptional regulator [Listeria rocourtiae]MBC1605308.1 Crp/Fnr family transcriptional regulator [Listeria rocourtiae]